MIMPRVAQLEEIEPQGVDTTQKLDRLIAAAPNIGLSVSPAG